MYGVALFPIALPVTRKDVWDVRCD